MRKLTKSENARLKELSKNLTGDLPDHLRFIYINFLMEANEIGIDYILAVKSLIHNSAQACGDSDIIWYGFRTNSKQKKPRQII
jgi:hypothetical protein